MKKLTLLASLLLAANLLCAQHSVARLWNEATLDAIRGDFARPTVHARNLFHTSAAMYDAWAVYSGTADTYFLGKTVHGFEIPFTGTLPPADVKAAQSEAISFAVYRLLRHRFSNSPRSLALYAELDSLMATLGYNPAYTSTDYKCCPAALGNYLAAKIIEFGLQDGSNEALLYQNQFYEPVNPPLVMSIPGNPNISDLNRWQPLALAQIIDQSGNPVPGNVQRFLSPEWGQVLPFSLQSHEATIYQRDGNFYPVYHDPGMPPQLDVNTGGGLSKIYKWGHELVAVWSSHLDPADGVLWDISPASIGNIQTYPTDWEDLPDFYDLQGGGDIGPGHAVNPKTGLPYPPQVVHRGDYARVLAEFWADGPTSETPPGHWYSIFNYVNDQPALVKKVRGQGPLCDNLEWDVKGYFALGGALHDVAITAWGIKGWYDSSRPVSAIRGMAELGQSTDTSLPNYHPGGLELLPGFVEIIQPGDTLQGANGQFVGEVKLLAWRGPAFVGNPASDAAGVDWVRAKEWWPYQRPTFVTPPFAGYISGHSTYSRAAAEVLTALTGDPFFPGGMGKFYCPKNEYLVFEDGPSEDLTLQWATYRDASDQCSLSRIWGSIHPPFDDVPGRLIGMKIGVEAFLFAEQYFTKKDEPAFVQGLHIYPNPTGCVAQVELDFEGEMPVKIYAGDGRLVRSLTLQFINYQAFVDLSDLPNGMYAVVGYEGNKKRVWEGKVVVQN